MEDSLTQNKIQTSKKLLKAFFNIRIPLSLGLLAILVALFLGIFIAKFNPASLTSTSLTYSQEVEGFKINLKEAQLTNNIKVSQKAAPAPKDKDFLVLIADIDNASSSARQAVFGNYFRLEEEGGKKIAPLPLNVNFAVPPKSSLEKQLVFLVDKNKDSFKLLIGELDKDPKIVEVKF